MFSRLRKRIEAQSAACEYWEEMAADRAEYGPHADCENTDQRAAYKRAKCELGQRRPVYMEEIYFYSFGKQEKRCISAVAGTVSTPVQYYAYELV